MTILERIDAATTNSNKWNYWPDQMELVKLTVYDLTEANAAYEAGKLIGNYQAYRQINWHQFPSEARVPVYYWNSHSIAQPARFFDFYPHEGLVYTHFRLAYSKGQMDSEATRNIFAMWELRTHGSYKANRLIVAEIGCKHDYDSTGSRMCYTVGTCRKCGHKFTCDSGD